MGEVCMDFLSKSEYEASVAATRDERMQWWREARFGMFVHFGLYALLGRPPALSGFVPMAYR